MAQRYETHERAAPSEKKGQDRCHTTQITTVTIPMLFKIAHKRKLSQQTHTVDRAGRNG